MTSLGIVQFMIKVDLCGKMIHCATVYESIILFTDQWCKLHNPLFTALLTVCTYHVSSISCETAFYSDFLIPMCIKVLSTSIESNHKLSVKLSFELDSTTCESVHIYTLYNHQMIDSENIPHNTAVMWITYNRPSLTTTLCARKWDHKVDMAQWRH